jgi:cyclopropane fatty-acyl-phospholipid synthase-like methyltransferase
MDYKEHPKRLARNDFWGQVRRTQNGRRISEEEITVIVDTIRRGLELDGGDVLLDLACGNGALSSRLFPDCASLLGIDYSEYLVDVAQEFFADPPDFAFAVADADAYMVAETDPERFTRFLCYGSFAYFSPATAHTVLHELHDRFTNVTTAYLGNLPDRALAERYYAQGTEFATLLDDHEAQIGIWRTQEQMGELAAECGWQSRFTRLPPGVFNSHYRYDVILTRG